MKILLLNTSRGWGGAEEQMLTARQNVNVVAADVDGIRLVPMRSFTVSGRLRFDARPQDSTAHYTVNLRSVNAPDDSGFFMASDAFGQSATVDRQGGFQWTNVKPGTYSVHLYGGDRDSYLKSVTLGESDVDTGFSISGPVTLDLVVSPKGGRVEGAVTDHAQPVADATFKAVRDRFGPQGVIDLIAASGYYSIVSMVLNVDRYPLPAGEEPPLKPL